MRTLVSYILFLLLIAGPRLWAQTSSSTSELEQLKSLVAIQQRELEQQQTDIQALQLSLAEQKEILAGVKKSNGGPVSSPCSRSSRWRCSLLRPSARGRRLDRAAPGGPARLAARSLKAEIFFPGSEGRAPAALIEASDERERQTDRDR